MNSQDWNKIKEVFNEAVELPIGERQEFLCEQFNGNDKLRLEVEKMLAFDDESDTDGIEKNAFQHFTTGIGLQFPEKIGKYRIIRGIGRGGMGAVYEAVREAENFTQRVALKVIKRGMDTDAILSRFRHEQQILSSLEHSNIARFLDGGMTEDNLPFYAMEFVEGEFIGDYCENRNLSIKGRLEIFRKVCDAVQFAHQNLVIHRDLKPKNILVTESGTPKLLDFGIGKILSSETTDEIGTATKFGMMTPAYASPEQIRGERIGTSSDIYSLGVILFELLTGEKPYKIPTNSQLEFQNAILETEPAKPSLAVSSGRLTVTNKNSEPQTQNSKLLKGDIDNIILKALRKNPIERYSSAQEFSEDIRRHLEGLPVYARPLTLKYRASKFFHRNKVTVIAGFLVFLSLLTGITVAVWQAFEARKAEQIAQKRFEDVRQLANNVVFKYHDAIENLPGSTEARKMLVTDALKYLDNLAENATDNPSLQKELARAYLKMGDVQGKMYAANIGDTKGALESYEKAVDLMEKTVENYPNDIEAKEILIQAYDLYAFITLRNGAAEADSTKEIVHKAIALHEEVIRTEPNNDDRKIRLIELFVRLGDTDTGNSAERKKFNDEQNFEIRLNHHQKALPLAEALLQTDNNDFEKIRTLARVYQRIGTDYNWLGEQAERFDQIEKSEEMFSKALEFHTKMYELVKQMQEIEPENNISKRYFSVALTNMAKSFSSNGKFEKALEMANENLILVNATLTEDKANREAEFDLSLGYEVFSEIYFRQKDYESALKYRLKTLELDEQIYASDNQNIEVFLRTEQHHKLLAKNYELLGKKKIANFHRDEFNRLEKLREQADKSKI